MLVIRSERGGSRGVERRQVKAVVTGTADDVVEIGGRSDRRVCRDAGEDLARACGEEDASPVGDGPQEAATVFGVEGAGSDRAVRAAYASGGAVRDHRAEETEPSGVVQLALQFLAEVREDEGRQAGRRGGRLGKDALVVPFVDSDALEDVGARTRAGDGARETPGDADGRVDRQIAAQPWMLRQPGGS